MVALPGIEADALSILSIIMEISKPLSTLNLQNGGKAQNYDVPFFTHLMGKFKPRFQTLFGTNWDKSSTATWSIHTLRGTAVRISPGSRRRISPLSRVAFTVRPFGNHPFGSDRSNSTTSPLGDTLGRH
jgi:hypothetical protein